jgi:hypothetical protein
MTALKRRCLTNNPAPSGALKEYRMKVARVQYMIDDEKIERTFRTNDNGNYLFVGDDNKQLFCDSGYNNKNTMRKAIREHAIYQAMGGNVSRIKYDWRMF